MTEEKLSTKTSSTDGISFPKDLQAAYFDVDGTLSKSNIVEPLLYIKKMQLSAAQHRWWVASLPFRFAYWTVLDKIDRRLASSSIYSLYAGLSVEEMRIWALDCCQKKYKAKLFKAGIGLITSLKNEGVRIVFVSGSLNLFLQPLADELGAELIASKLTERSGFYAGADAENIVSGITKAELIKAHATENNFDLSYCAAFGDSADDINMLNAVGHPTAINPDKKLATRAKSQQWNVLGWR